MSFSSYNVNINNVSTPYVSSCSELGSFNGTSSGYTNWNSLSTSLITSNGIATINNSGLTITNPGVYKINVSIDILGSNDSGAGVTCNFAFGTSKNTEVTSPLGLLGGTNSIYLRNKGQYNANDPGIITWITSANTSGDSIAESVYTSNTTYGTYYSYNYNNNNSNESYPGICTTELCFTTNSSATLYFNVSGNSDAGQTVTIGLCYFVLQLISTTPFPPPFPPPPFVESVSPTSGSNETLVTITGSNLNNNLMHVYFDNNSATVLSSSSTQITCYPPSKSTGTVVEVTVVTNGGTSNNNNTFTYIETPPTITSYSPNSGPSGTIVTVNGTYFVNNPSIMLTYYVYNSGIPTPDYTVVQPDIISSSQLKFNMPTLPNSISPANPNVIFYVVSGSYVSNTKTFNYTT